MPRSTGVSMTWPHYLNALCRVNGRLQRLPDTQASLLAALLLSDPDKFTHVRDLVPIMWPNPDRQPEGTGESINVYVHFLRRRQIIIENRHGFGYRIPRHARG